MPEDTPSIDTNVTQNSLLDSSSTDTPTDTPSTDTPTDTPSTDTPSIGTFEDLLGSLPEDMRDNASLKKYNSFEDLAKGFIEQGQLVGRKTTIPGEDATDDDWNTFYNNAGRPTAANEYNIQLPEELAAFPNAQERADEAFKAAYEAGLSKKQATTLFNSLFEGELKDAQALAQQNADNLSAAKTKLSEAWGNDFDTNAAKVTALQKQLGVFDAFEEQGLNANPDLLIAMSKLAKDLKVDSPMDTMHNEQSDGISAEIDSLRNLMLEANRTGDTVKRDEIRIKLNKLYDQQK